MHAARFNHPLGNIAFPFRWFLNRGPVPVDGDGTTVMRISWNRLDAVRGVGTSVVAADLRRRRSGTTPASPCRPASRAIPMSPFYFDQNETWRTGQYRTQPFSRGAVTGAAKHRLLLVP